jgi:hypothetical protein
MSMSYLELITIALMTVMVMSVGMGVMFLYMERLRSRGRENYDQEKMRSQLEIIRDSLEKDLYKIEDRLSASEKRWEDTNHLILSSTKAQSDILDEPASAPLTNFLRAFGLTKKDMAIERDLVFVLTPFHKQKLSTYQIILRVCNDVGLRCVRGDEEFIKGDLLAHIIKLLVRARLVIANVEGRNPNVFYELGIAQAIDKPTILVCKTSFDFDVPFDIKSRQLILYKDKASLENELKQALTKALAKT